MPPIMPLIGVCPPGQRIRRDFHAPLPAGTTPVVRGVTINYRPVFHVEHDETGISIEHNIDRHVPYLVVFVDQQRLKQIAALKSFYYAFTGSDSE